MDFTYINEGNRNEVDFDIVEEHGELLRSISYFLDDERMYRNVPHEAQKQKRDTRIEKFSGAGVTVVPCSGKTKAITS
jgi:hypothetical protein